MSPRSLRVTVDHFEGTDGKVYEWGREGDYLVAYDPPTTDGENCCGVTGAHDRPNHEELLGPAAEPWPRPDCCGCATLDEHGCHDCYNTGHAHDPNLPCDPREAVLVSE